MESVDHYKYPGEDVLINEFDCHDAEDLAMLEALSTGGNLAYLQLHPIKGKFDFKHLKTSTGLYSRMYIPGQARCAI